MTDREKAIVMAHTGIAMLTGEKFSIFHKYIEDLLGRPVWTHELAIEAVWNEIEEKSKPDFLKLCTDEPEGHWIPIEPDCRGYTEVFECSRCKNRVQYHYPMKKSEYPNCPYCLVEMKD